MMNEEENKQLNTLSLADRVLMINEYNSRVPKPSLDALAKKYGVNSSLVRNIILNKAFFLSAHAKPKATNTARSAIAMLKKGPTKSTKQPKVPEVKKKVIALKNESQLSLLQRVKVINKYNSRVRKPSITEFAKKFRVSVSQIAHILANQEAILKWYNEASETSSAVEGVGDDSCEREIKQRQHKINFLGKVLYEYVQRSRYHKRNIDSKMLLEKAREITDCIAIEDFRLTQTWLDNFRQIYGTEDFEFEPTWQTCASANFSKCCHWDTVDLVQYVRDQKCKKCDLKMGIYRDEIKNLLQKRSKSKESDQLKTNSICREESEEYILPEDRLCILQGNDSPPVPFAIERSFLPRNDLLGYNTLSETNATTIYLPKSTTLSLVTIDQPAINIETAVAGIENVSDNMPFADNSITDNQLETIDLQSESDMSIKSEISSDAEEFLDEDDATSAAKTKERPPYSLQFLNAPNQSTSFDAMTPLDEQHQNLMPEVHGPMSLQRFSNSPILVENSLEENTMEYESLSNTETTSTAGIIVGEPNEASLLTDVSTTLPIGCMEDAVRHLKLLKDFALLENNELAVSLLELLADVFIRPEELSET